jgi:hypothetical protein
MLYNSQSCLYSEAKRRSSNFLPLTEPGSSHKPPTDTYRKPNKSIPTFFFIYIHFNIVLSRPKSSEWSPSFTGLPTTILNRAPISPRALHAIPILSSFPVRTSNIGDKYKLHYGALKYVVLFSLMSLWLASKYSPQHPNFKKLQCVPSP